MLLRAYYIILYYFKNDLSFISGLPFQFHPNSGYVQDLRKLHFSRRWSPYHTPHMGVCLITILRNGDQMETGNAASQLLVPVWPGNSCRVNNLDSTWRSDMMHPYKSMEMKNVLFWRSYHIGPDLNLILARSLTLISSRFCSSIKCSNIFSSISSKVSSSPVIS